MQGACFKKNQDLGYATCGLSSKRINILNVGESALSSHAKGAECYTTDQLKLFLKALNVAICHLQQGALARIHGCKHGHVTTLQDGVTKPLTLQVCSIVVKSVWRERGLNVSWRRFCGWWCPHFWACLLRLMSMLLDILICCSRHSLVMLICRLVFHEWAFYRNSFKKEENRAWWCPLLTGLYMMSENLSNLLFLKWVASLP